MDLADARGIAPVSIRKIGAAMGCAPMSIYYYFPNKDALLDAMVDRVFAQIDLPQSDTPWPHALRQRSVSMRMALLRHPWAIGLLDSRRQPGPATLRHHEAVLECLRSQGFSLANTAHAFALLDAYIYGFALQAASLPFNGPDELKDVADTIFTPESVTQVPRMTEFARDYALLPGYDFEDEFERGLDVVISGIEVAFGPS